MLNQAKHIANPNTEIKLISVSLHIPFNMSDQYKWNIVWLQFTVIELLPFSGALVVCCRCSSGVVWGCETVSSGESTTWSLRASWNMCFFTLVFSWNHISVSMFISLQDRKSSDRQKNILMITLKFILFPFLEVNRYSKSKHQSTEVLSFHRVPKLNEFSAVELALISLLYWV